MLWSWPPDVNQVAGLFVSVDLTQSGYPQRTTFFFCLVSFFFPMPDQRLVDVLLGSLHVLCLGKRLSGTAVAQISAVF